MAHASGNPTWQDYPSTATPITALALEQMEAGIDGAIKQTRPVVEARLTADYTTLAGNSYYGMRGQMTANIDTHGMWSQPGGGLYLMTVQPGWAGRYDFYWTIWADSVTGSLAPIVYLNAPAGTANASLGPYTAYRQAGSAIGSELLAVGDTISLGAYCFQTGSWNMRTGLSGATNARTKAVIRWVGPN